MARTVRGGSLESRAARLRLEPRGKPYYVASAKPGLHLGYRRLEGVNGRWVIRRYQGGGGQVYETDVFAQADDYSAAYAGEVLTYHQAMQKVSGEIAPVRSSSGYTVANAMTAYIEHLDKRSKDGSNTAGKLEAYITEEFGRILLRDLTATDLDGWVTWALARRRPKAKNPRPEKGPPKPPVPVAELRRRRKTTVNRVITALKAMLEFAYSRKQVHSREAWADLQKFPGVESARLHRLTAVQARQLIEVCPADFRRLVEVALLTGCRYGELCALTAQDYDPNGKTLLVAESKSGRSRRIPLTKEGSALLQELTEPLEPHAPILTKADGTSWAQSEQWRRMAAACVAAKITPPISFHALRHSFASLLVEKGTPLMFVSTVLGHTDTRMVEAHYAHLAPSIVAKSIRKNLPTFGVQLTNQPKRGKQQRAS